jgi:hypothetical protein
MKVTESTFMPKEWNIFNKLRKRDRKREKCFPSNSKALTIA